MNSPAPALQLHPQFSQLSAFSAARINSVSNLAHTAEAISMKNNSQNKHKKEISVSPSL